MSNSADDSKRGSGWPLTSLLLAALVTVGLAAVSYAVLPLFGRASGFWGVVSVLPLFVLVGGALALVQFSLERGDWKAFGSAKLRYLFLYGVPLALLGVANGDPALWLAGAIGLLAALVGLAKPDGLAVGLKRAWKLLLLSLALGGIVFSLWLLFGCTADKPELDEHGCLVGTQDWCEHGQKCIRPWVDHCGDSTTVDSFYILKKVMNFSGLELSRPMQDQFTWIEDSEDELVRLYVPGLTSHVEGVDLDRLHRAFIKAELKPSEVNSEDIETGGLRGYRYYDIVVCSASFAESATGQGVDVGLSCGPLAEGRPE